MEARHHEIVKRQRARNGSKSFIRDVFIIVIVAVLAAFLIKTYLVRSFFIPSQSMEPTLEVHDRILVDELVPRILPLRHGDIIVFKDPDTWLPHSRQPAFSAEPAAIFQTLASAVGISSSDDNDHLVKRVIGLPGDHVSCCNALGQLSVNGEAIHEPYVRLKAGSNRVSMDDFAVTVPPKELWVLGDNRYESADSRYHPNSRYKGFVPETDVVGRASVISWPITRWTWLTNYPSSFDGL